MRRRLCVTAVALYASYLPLSMGECSAGSNGDELAWKDLVKMTAADGVPTPTGQSAAGWRLWVTRDYLFPDQGQDPPAQASFSNYKDFVCHKQSLTIRVKDATQTDEFCEATFFSPEAAQKIIDKRLYVREELLAHLKALKAANQKFQFSSCAREIKTEWKILADDTDAPPGYFIAQDQQTGKRYALVALHLQSHELPDSLWATWMHKDYLDRLDSFPVVDSYGGQERVFPSRKLRTLLTKNLQLTWLNYRLIGTQVSPGKRASLGNPLIEGVVFGNHLEKSSCMTCHSQAAVGDRGEWRFRPDLPPGTKADLSPFLTALDSSFSLTIAPRCEHVSPTCSEFARVRPNPHSPAQTSRSAGFR